MSEQPPVEPQKARNSKTMAGAWITAASGIIAAVGPQVLEAALGMQPAAAQECVTSIVAAMNVLAAQLVVIGRANANIKPLG